MSAPVHKTGRLHEFRPAIPDTGNYFNLAGTLLPCANNEGSRASMTMTRDLELWGIALWLEKNHGEIAWFFPAQQQDRRRARY